MSDANKTEDSDFEDVVAKILADEDVHTECGDPLFNLYIKPNYIILF